MAEKITKDLGDICISDGSDKKLGEIRRLIEAGADVNKQNVCESHRRNQISPLNYNCIFLKYFIFIVNVDAMSLTMSDLVFLFLFS